MAEKNYVKPVLWESREASEDMDNAYRAVKINASDSAKIDLCDTAGEKPFGVIQLDWDDGDIVEFINRGPAIVEAGAAVAAGATVSVDSSGRAITTVPSSHDWQLGEAKTAATAAGDQITVDVDIHPVDMAALYGYGFRLWKARTTAPQAETDLFTLPAKAIVVKAFVDVITPEATGTTTVDVGTSTVSNDPDGFLDGVDVSSAAIVKGTLASGGQTLGALLYADESGAGVLVPEEDVTSFGAVVSVTPGSLGNFAELVADVYVAFYELG